MGEYDRNIQEMGALLGSLELAEATTDTNCLENHYVRESRVDNYISLQGC